MAKTIMAKTIMIRTNHKIIVKPLLIRHPYKNYLPKPRKNIVYKPPHHALFMFR